MPSKSETTEARRLAENTLYYGDNLDVLRRYVKDESVDLVYLDPPFNSNQDYNVLFAEKDGTRAAAQIKAFGDTWQWDTAAAAAYQEIVTGDHPKVSQAMQAFRTFLGENDMLAYLSMIAPRLVELRRVLKSTGSIYLHCDPTASHYLKLIMDAVFGPENYVNEIIWKRQSSHNDAKQGSRHFGRVHDVILFYRKTDNGTLNHQYRPYDDDYVAKAYRHIEEKTGRRYRLSDMTAPGGASEAKRNPYYEFLGVTRYWRYSEENMHKLYAEGRIVQTKPGTVPQFKRYLDEGLGVPVGTVWDDIELLQAADAERLGYPTQKPESLLERIVKAGSNEGDTVLDPFCGCGTTIAAAQKLGRKWIGIDITHLSISLIKHRFFSAFGEKADKLYKVIGEPVDQQGAAQLAEDDPYQFQWWALSLVHARPVEQKKGADKGIDGRLYFHDDGSGKTRQVIFSVKAGHTSSPHLRDLRGVLQRENAEIGVLICLQEPTSAMRKEAASAGFYESKTWGKKYPQLQILTIADLLDGRAVEMPPIRVVNATFKQAPKAKGKKTEEPGLPFGKTPDELETPW